MKNKIEWIKNHKAISLIILVGVGFFAYYMFCALRWIQFPASTDYGEGFVIDYAKLFANGAWKWNINVPPYLTMVYGIGYPMIMLPFVKLFGYDLWVGRMVSVISAFIACGLIYLIVKKLTGKKVYGLIACLLPFTQFIFRDWSIMARVDMTAVMFDLLGVYLVIKWQNSKLSYLAIIPFIIAMMTKLTAVAGLVAVLIYFLIYNRKKFLAFAGLLVAGMAIVIIPLMIASGGEYLKDVILYENTINNINITNMTYLLGMFLFAGIILVVPSIIYLVNNGKKITLAGLYLIVAFIIGLVGTLRIGSAGVYYLEAIIAGCICTTLALPVMIEYFKNNVKWWAMALVCIIVACCIGYTPRPNYEVPSTDYLEAVKKVQSITVGTDKPIITEAPDIVLGMGKELYIEPFVFTNIARLGYWDDTNYVSGFTNKGYDYVLLRWSINDRLDILNKGSMDITFSDEVIRDINNNYSLVWQDGLQYPYSLYLYRVN